MIDLHMHILAGMDDGASSIQEAVRMAEIASDCRVKAVAATCHAHFSPQTREDYVLRYRKQMKRLRAELEKRRIPLKVYSGAEILVDKSTSLLLSEKQIITINGSRYPLIEFPFGVAGETLFREALAFLDYGYTPIIAHPERYDCVKEEYGILYRLYEAGILLQINKGSLLGEFGQRAKKAAFWMLDHCLAHVVASDSHDSVLRTPDLEETARIMELAFGLGSVEILLNENPRRILANREVIRSR